MTYRPEALAPDKIATFFRLAGDYGGRGRRRAGSSGAPLAKTLRHSPRSLRQVVMQLGMYKHFRELQRANSAWDPWAALVASAPPIGALRVG